MAAPQPGCYIIRPKEPSEDALFIGPVPLRIPPPDVLVKVASLPRPVESFLLIQAVENTFTVFATTGEPSDYKFIVKDNVLYVSSVLPPDRFRFESAGDNLYVIGIPNEDSLLTFNKDAPPESPQLTFKPADGSDAQRFRLQPVFKD